MLFVSCLSLLLLAAFPSGPSRQTREEEPRPQGRRLVILGSSTAAGAGASSYRLSWAGRLTEALAPLGITVINRSISGSNTAASIQRFQRDVEALRPNYVVFSTSLHNELVLTRREEARKEFVENLKDAGKNPVPAKEADGGSGKNAR